jgi:rRNA maturation endonuclease Nob1
MTEQTHHLQINAQNVMLRNLQLPRIPYNFQRTPSIPDQLPIIKKNPASCTISDHHSMISTELLTKKSLPTESTTAEFLDIESKCKMETEVDSQKSEVDEKDTLPSPEERDEARRQTLSRQGFVLQEDAHGLRLSGIASRPRGLRSQLSPYDVVRLAAELEGSDIVPMEQRKRCPNCDAVVNPNDKRCQWCSEVL